MSWCFGFSNQNNASQLISTVESSFFVSISIFQHAGETSFSIGIILLRGMSVFISFLKNCTPGKLRFFFLNPVKPSGGCKTRSSTYLRTFHETQSRFCARRVGLCRIFFNPMMLFILFVLIFCRYDDCLSLKWKRHIKRVSWLGLGLNKQIID